MTTTLSYRDSKSVFLCIRNCPKYNHTKKQCTIDIREPLKKSHCMLRDEQVGDNRVLDCPNRTRSNRHKCMLTAKSFRHMQRCFLHGSMALWKCKRLNP